MSDAVKMAMGMVSGQNDPSNVGADFNSGGDDAPFEVGNGNLHEFLNRRRGGNEQEQKRQEQDDIMARMEALEAKHAAELQRARDDAETYRKQLERTSETMDRLANRPVNVQYQQPQQQQQPQLPTLELDDPDLAAAFNTFDSRQDAKMNNYLRQIDQRINAQAIASQQREFEQTLKQWESKPGFKDDNYNRDEIIRNAKAIIQNNPNQFIDWNREFELGYNAKMAPTYSKELEELRKYKQENETRQARAAAKQKQNLSQVPQFGARGGSETGKGLLADSILSDARKNGKRLSWSQFGNEFKRRRSG